MVAVMYKSNRKLGIVKLNQHRDKSFRELKQLNDKQTYKSNTYLKFADVELQKEYEQWVKQQLN